MLRTAGLTTRFRRLRRLRLRLGRHCLCGLLLCHSLRLHLLSAPRWRATCVFEAG